MDPLYRRAPRIAARVIEGAAYVVAVDQQRMVELDEVGTFVWEHLREPASVQGLTDLLTEEFDVDGPRARADLEKFLALLEERGLVISDVEGQP